MFLQQNRCRWVLQYTALQGETFSFLRTTTKKRHSFHYPTHMHNCTLRKNTKLLPHGDTYLDFSVLWDQLAKKVALKKEKEKVEKFSWHCTGFLVKYFFNRYYLFPMLMLFISENLSQCFSSDTSWFRSIFSFWYLWVLWTTPRWLTKHFRA